MKMPIRLQDNVPEVYVNESRDFQLLCRLYDCIINGVKFDIDSIRFITDTHNCNSRLLDLLKTKVGFFNDKYIFSDDMRLILEAFPYIVKWKGSKKGILEAIRLYLKINKTDVDTELIINEEKCEIEIKIKAPLDNITILDEVLKYIIPAGYTVKYSYYENEVINDVVYLKNIVIYNKGRADSIYSNGKNGLNAGFVEITNVAFDSEKSEEIDDGSIE